jgi:hypothetical protein
VAYRQADGIAGREQGVAGDQNENWRLILEAARALTAAGQSPFTRIGVYEWIWRRYPRSEHDRPSLDPVFQGMIRNAPGGLVSSAGTPLARIGRGEYVLASAAAAPGDDSTGPGPRSFVPASGRSRAALTEDEVKQGAKEYLEAAGFRVTVAWGRQRGIDIRAVSGAEVMLLEAKGSAVNPPQQVNYFLGALGELLQRMSDASATYGLVLPDSQQYRGLAVRLPALAWQRLRLTVLFVSKDIPRCSLCRCIATSPECRLAPGRICAGR